MYKHTKLHWQPVGDAVSVMLMPNNTCIVGISGLTCGPTQDPQDADLFVGTAQDAADLLQHLQRHYALSDDDLVNLRLFLLEHV